MLVIIEKIQDELDRDDSGFPSIEYLFTPEHHGHH